MTVNRQRKTRRTATPASAVDAVYEALLLQIVRGELTGGTTLKSTQLARDLNVSRTPVVQALQRLAADGIVTQRLNYRAVVRPGAEKWLVEIHQMRELLEPHAAALAAGNVPAEALVELERLAQAARPRRRGDWKKVAQEFDFALHLAIAQHCGNYALGEAIRKCWSFKRLSYLAAPERPETLEQSYGEHLAIVQALRSGDAATARAAVQFHLRSAASMRPTQTIV
ncbi:MAG: GntR family transcriptional regulator [Planctomycetes bacterium]|nr:GntR family transcriptional regulator [Planctomycetota bacterium]